MTKPAMNPPASDLPRGLYLITNDDPWPILQNKLHAALSCGVAMMQYRRKHTLPDQQAAEAAALLAICQQYDVPLLINDDVQLANALGCGVHLGQGDGSLQAARALLGAQAMIGRTCHGDIELAKQAVADGASYVAFGAVYASGTKPLAHRVELSVLQQAKQQLDVPVCVIGGLAVDNVQPLLEYGVDLYAVVGDVLNASVDQIEARVLQWHSVLQPLTKPVL